MWAITGMSTRAIASMVAAIGIPPSSFTMLTPPSFTRRMELRTAALVPCWKAPNGRSPTTMARRAPRLTMRQWYTISSRVTGSVVSWPWTTMPRESPTRSRSTPASSRSLAKVAS